MSFWTKKSISPEVRRRKAGFGIMEILISAAVLGFMIVALNMLQTSNRDTIIRIRTRDGAVAVSQEVLDSLSAVGVASLQMPASGNKVVLHKIRRWDGKPGASSGHKMTVDYTVRIGISNDVDYQEQNPSLYHTTQHVYAKKVDVEVEWTYKGTPHSINMSTVLR